MTSCNICGTRTGLHGFSFDNKEEFPLVKYCKICLWNTCICNGEWKVEMISLAPVED